MVEGVVACLKNNKNFKLFESLNLGTGVSTPMGDVVKIISNLLGIRKKIRFDQTTLGKSDLNHCADINKINSLTGWKPKIDLKTGLKKTIKSY